MQLQQKRDPPLVQQMESSPVQQMESPLIVQQMESPLIVQQMESPLIVQQMESPLIVLQMESPLIVQQMESPLIVQQMESPLIVQQMQAPPLIRYIQGPPPPPTTVTEGPVEVSSFVICAVDMVWHMNALVHSANCRLFHLMEQCTPLDLMMVMMLACWRPSLRQLKALTTILTVQKRYTI